MVRFRTQNIVIAFLVLVLLIFFGVTVIAYRINAKKKQIFVQSNIEQIKKSVNLAYTYESNRVSQVLISNSFWDEMVNFVEKDNPVWAKSNIDPIVSSFKLDAMWVFDIRQNLRYCSTNEKHSDLNSYPFENFVFDSILNRKFVNYYIETQNGVLEIFGASIHPSTDPQRVTKPRGFLLIGRYCDNIYLEHLSAVSSTNATLVYEPIVNEEAKSIHQIEFNIPLEALNDKVIKYLHIEKSLDYFEQFEKFSLKLIVLYYLSALIIFIALIFVFSRWVNKPLLIVENILEKDDLSKATELNRFGSEFSKIGQLITSYISQKRALEVLKNKAEESDRLKSAFMANMSHEIRTPLNGIVGFSELLCSSNTNDETTENYRKIIRKCSNNLMRLISDILDYSKIEAGQLVINKEEFSTESLFTELSNHYESKAETLIQKGIHLIFKKTGGVVVFNSDKQRIKQILINLISNSIKFTEHGAIEIDFYTDGKNIVFTVMDTGIGISEEVQQVIFKRFWQAVQPKANKLYGGTGLGLALSKGLVELLGGKISVKSKLGYGSIFSVEIPLLKEI